MTYSTFLPFVSSGTSSASADGGDISSWQDLNTTPQMFNFPKAKAMGWSFCGIKISQANWADSDYALNWANCKRYLYRLPYHFMTWDIDPKRQAEVFWSLLEKDTWGLLPLTCDFEWWRTTPLTAMDTLYNFMERLKVLSAPLPLGIYTAKSFWDPNGSIDDYWKQYHLWLCDIVGDVQIPLPWDKWTFWQYTFKLDGLAYGAESLDLDGDHFNGTVEQMKAQFNLPELDEPIVTPPVSIPAGTALQFSAVGSMNTRSGPGTGNALKPALSAGEIVDVLNVAGYESWIEIEPGRWAAIYHNGLPYMKKVS